MLLILCVILGVTFGVISDYSEKASVIISTAFGGAYLLIKGIGMLAGNYPDEFTIAERIKLNQFPSIPTFYYVYISLMFVLGAVGCYVQYNLMKKTEEDEIKSSEEAQYEDDNYKSIGPQDVSIDLEQPQTSKNKKPVQKNF